MKWIIFVILIAFGSAPGNAVAQPTGCEVRGGGDANDCYNCQFIRDEHDVWDHENIVIRTLPEQVQEGPGAVEYHCTENTTASTLGTRATVTATESTSFSGGGSAGARVGVNVGLVADASFNINANTGNAQSVSNSVTLTRSQNNVSDCEGIGIETEYTTFKRTGTLTEYALVSYYECDCVVFGDGFVLEGALVTYQCYPRYIAARSDLVRSSLNVWVRAASFNPPRAPSEFSPSRCSYCADDDDGCDCSDDLDPDGDEDGDGTRNADDDRPYGYDGDDPDGDDDGDGTRNADDATPYGYDGDDPDGDDDGDGTKNSMDPTPNGGTLLPPVIFTLPHQLPIELRLE